MSNTVTKIEYSKDINKIFIGEKDVETKEWIGSVVDITQEFINALVAYIPKGLTREFPVRNSKDKSLLSVDMFAHFSEDEKSIDEFISFLTKLKLKFHSEPDTEPKENSIKNDKADINTNLETDN